MKGLKVVNRFLG